MAEGIALVLPHPLPPGGTIGVAAASSPFEERSEIDRSVRWYEERGYRVKLADGVYARDDFVAGDAAARARDVNQLFADPEVDVVQLLRGGSGPRRSSPTSTSTRSPRTRSRSTATPTSRRSTSQSANLDGGRFRAPSRAPRRSDPAQPATGSRRPPVHDSARRRLMEDVRALPARPS